MFFSLAVSSLISSLGLVSAAKLMNMGLTFVQALIVCVLTGLASLFFPEQNLAAFALVFAVYLIGLKLFTSESIIAVVKLALVGMIISVALVETGLLAALGVAGAAMS